MQNHYLASYLRSLKAVLTVQFTSKGHKGGKSGVAQLAEESLTVRVRSSLPYCSAACCIADSSPTH